MKIFITGASGFIGQVVLTKLLEDNHEVTAIYSRNPVQQTKSSAQLESYSNLNMIQLDLLDNKNLTHYLAGHDCVIHLAYNFRGTAQEQFAFATQATQSLLTACAEARIKKLVYSSTISVYGEPPPSGLITEASPRLASLQPYALSKQATEKLFLESADGETEIVILQPSIVYGPGKGSWSYGLLNRMREAFLPIVNHGEGYCNPIYVDDVAQAIIQACETPNLHKECFIITNDKPVKWREFLNYYESILGGKTFIDLPYYIYNHQTPIPRYRRGFRKAIRRLSEVFYSKPINYPAPDEIRFYAAQPIFSNQKARKLLNFQPQTSLEEGMSRVQKWWESSHN